MAHDVMGMINGTAGADLTGTEIKGQTDLIPRPASFDRDVGDIVLERRPGGRSCCGRPRGRGFAKGGLDWWVVRPGGVVTRINYYKSSLGPHAYDSGAI